MNTQKENVYDFSLFDSLLQSVNENVKTLVGLEKKVSQIDGHERTLKERRPLQEKNTNVVSTNTTATSCQPPSVKRTDLIFTGTLERHRLTPQKEISIMSNQIASIASQITEYIYCPFCPLRYKKKQSLKTHLKQNHRAELDQLRTKNLDSFNFQTCPKCSAKFYLNGICIKHFVTYHNQFIADVWDVLCDKQATCCMFCQAPFHDTKTDAILKHFFTVHGEEFERTLFQLAQNGTSNETSIKKDMITECLSNSVNQSNLIRGGRSGRSGAKRALRFSVPEAVCHFYDEPIISRQSSVGQLGGIETTTDEMLKSDDDDEVTPSSRSPSTGDLSFTPARNCFSRRKKSRSPKPKFTSTPLKRHKRMGQKLKQKLHVLFHTRLSPGSPSKMFRCCACHVRYADNNQLVSHIKEKHQGLQFKLQPLFGCGVCTAQFYENSFLVKHCDELHAPAVAFTPPKCLLVSSPLFH